MTTPQPATALVTGAAGFIGSHLTEALLRRQMQVVGFDNLSTGNVANLATVRDYDAFHLVEGDLRDPSAVAQACEGVDVIFHLAAVINIAESVRDPEKYHEINVTGTQNVIAGALQASVKRMIFASSAAVYGSPQTVPISEEVELTPLSPYGRSKVKGERLCQAASTEHGLCVPQLRIFNVYGPRQSAENDAGVISIFLNRSQQGLPLIVYGDGHQTRDFIYVDDVVEAFMRTALISEVQSVPINVGTGIPVSIRELAEEVQRHIPSWTGEIQFKPARPGDIYHSVARIDRMQHVLQFTPKYTLREGLAKTNYFDAEQTE